jgi:hypothetical protein
MAKKSIKNQDWLNLCEYVHTQIMGYDETMKLSKYMILRLQGLSKGIFIANNHIEEQAKYDYKTILITFKFCKLNILQGFESNKGNFKDDSHKFNYALSIVDKEINNIVRRLNDVKKSEEKTINIDLENQVHETAKYKKQNKKVSEDLKELW